MDIKDFEEILEQVEKPGRYLGGEWNAATKVHSKDTLKIALCFPDIYEVGMSHLGFRIIYGVLNSLADVVCERVFCPWPDFSGVLLKKDLPLFSLESRTPINKFDIVAFTLAYEMSFTNVLEVLRLSKIPFRSKDRGIEQPIVIGGGTCTLNPEPVADFFDLFVVGEGEEAVIELADAFRKMKISGQNDKSKILAELAKIDGVYVPSFYKTEYDSDGKINTFLSMHKNAPSVIKKRIVKNLDDSFYPTKYIVPYINIVHDRVVLEIMRGCAHRCRFCQAQAHYKPLRMRSEEKILSLIEESLNNTGYEEFSLMSLSSGDYPNIDSFVERLSNMPMLKEKGISTSLSSLRVEDVLSRLPQLIKKVKKTGITLAPEAGSERLRKLIRKDIDIENLLKAIRVAKEEGWRRIKLYFMIGLPTENRSDIDGILDILKETAFITKGNRFDIGVTLSPFIPKPFTSFQWEGMGSIEELLEKEAYIRGRLNSRNVNLKFHKPELSFIEAILSRGDRRLSNILERAFSLGAKLDGWDEFFKFDIWMDAFDKEGLDPAFYTKRRDFHETLPWDHINVGVEKETLAKDAEEAIKCNSGT
ncbi:MAG: B12-binding domain-containing radical SAM protein [Candidatus Omnitrophica bacterium CG07_land_8_20_14_0_80_42_15]|uniref:B12-binding domain-containing radical SAM protein n=1 Tax=Candidatus Aquitaenariimonas noxiae TaxID=1974741 RepID=A0A2J0KW85_9BACT|nr:MAG: B12-binding domain-containing radical SAM protein [Candidatus Omnitrophica bacterium CG07_land_8_20_14_0_80_42_15]